MDHRQTNGEDFAAIERQILELATQNVRAAQERADAEAALTEAERRVAEIGERLPAVEALAKKRRQARHDAVRDRAEIERRLSALLEEENSARSRRRQAEQLAAGFRSAEAFAALAGSEAARGGDGDRLVRETAVSARARVEAAQAEARVAELRAVEEKITSERAEVEGHVLAERDFERKLSDERDETEAEAASLRAELLAARHAFEEARETLQRLELETKHLIEQRTVAVERLKEGRRRARAELEERIAGLREEERLATQRRAEAEKTLAAFMQSENRANAEIAMRERDEAKRLAAERAERAEAERLEAEREARERAERETAEAAERAYAIAASGEDEHELEGGSTAEAAAHDEPATANAAPAAANATSPPVASVSNPHAFPGLSAPAAPGAGATPPAYGGSNGTRPAAAVPGDEPSLLLRSLIGLFGGRKKPAAPEPVLDGPSIADRIARDFGALGKNEAPPKPESEEAPPL